MDLDYARLLASPTGGQPARIFSRSEAAEMVRAAGVLDASDNPADRPLAASARGHIEMWQAFEEAQAAAIEATMRARRAKEEYRTATSAAVHTTDPAAAARARAACEASQVADEQARLAGNTLVRVQQVFKIPYVGA